MPQKCGFCIECSHMLVDKLSDKNDTEMESNVKLGFSNANDFQNTATWEFILPVLSCRSSSDFTCNSNYPPPHLLLKIINQLDGV